MHLPPNRISLLLAGALLALLVAIGRELYIDTSDHASYRTCTPRIIRKLLNDSEVPHSASHLNALARSVRNGTFPRVYRGAFSSVGWRAINHWSPEYFIHMSDKGIGPEQVLAKRSRDSVVKFANLRAARPYARTNEIVEQADGNVIWPDLPLFTVPFTSQNLSMRDFFSELGASSSALSKDRSSEYIYFSDGLGVLGALGRDVLPIEPLCPFDSVAKECDCSLWIGAGSVSAWPHYDSSHNLFVQIRGKKKFTLAHPSSIQCGVGLYPSLHPYYRQAQRDLLEEHPLDSRPSVIVNTANCDTDNASKPECCILTLYDVELEAGDALFIPPFWLHRVTSLSSISFSVNAWWESKELRTLARVGQLPLPFESEWSERCTLFATALYIRMVYEEMESYVRAQTPWNAPVSGPFLLAELLATRFIPLFDGQILMREWCESMQRNITDTVHNAMSACTHITIHELHLMLPDAHTDADMSSLLLQLRSRFSPYVSRMLTLYQRVPIQMARLHVHNTVEEISWFALDGHIDHLYPFLSCCVHTIN
jgi:hypothetical protein